MPGSIATVSSRGGLEGPLFTDAKAGEDTTQKVVAGEFPGDFAQGLLGLAEFFGEQFGFAGGQSHGGLIQGVAAATSTPSTAAATP